MVSDAEHARGGTRIASMVRCLLAPLALLVSFETSSCSALPSAAGAHLMDATAADSQRADSQPADSPLAASAPLDDTAPVGERRAVAATSVAATSVFGDAIEAEPPLCELADISVPAAPGSCQSADESNGRGPPPSPSEPEKQAAGDKSAPMCDASASSIAAPVEIPEVDRGRFELLPCDAQLLLALLQSDDREGGLRLVVGDGSRRPAPEQPASKVARQEAFAALSPELGWPERATPSMLAAACHRGLAGQRGHRARVYRPPSLRV